MSFTSSLRLPRDNVDFVTENVISTFDGTILNNNFLNTWDVHWESHTSEELF